MTFWDEGLLTFCSWALNAGDLSVCREMPRTERFLFFTTFHSSHIISLDPLSGSICVVNNKNLGLLVCLLLKGKVL